MLDREIDPGGARRIMRDENDFAQPQGLDDRREVAELLLDVLGPAALDSGSAAPLHGAIEDHWRYAQAATVASGTIEVQRMLVAREALGGKG